MKIKDRPVTLKELHNFMFSVMEEIEELAKSPLGEGAAPGAPNILRLIAIAIAKAGINDIDKVKEKAGVNNGKEKRSDRKAEEEERSEPQREERQSDEADNESP